MKSIFPFSIFVFMVLNCSAQVKTCTIFGTCPGREGNVIGAYQYDDYITYSEIKLDESVVNDSGKFSLKVEVDKVSYIFLRCKKTHGFLYAEPGRTVELNFPDRDFKSQINPEVDYVVPLSIYISDSTDMNFLADDYSIYFDKFWRKNFQSFVTKDSLEVLDTFHMQMKRQYAFVKNEYFMPWMDYGLASMEDGILHSQIQSGRKYLSGKKIYYQNSEYMTFFNSFFKEYMYKWTPRKEGQGMLFAVNNTISYDSLLSSMKRLPWIENDTLRELVMLKGLFESYNNPAFNSRNILSILLQAATRSKISEHRRIARNIISFYSKLKKGTEAVHFYGKNKAGISIDPLTTYKGHFVYLFFFATWNEHAMSEFRYMANLQKKYGKKIDFVSVSLDTDTNAYKAFLKANPKFNWMILHYDFTEKTKDDYNLFTVPTGYIINREGRLLITPTDNPTGDLEYNLYQIANPKAAPFIKIGDR